jgi:hypothetical protein
VKNLSVIEPVEVSMKLAYLAISGLVLISGVTAAADDRSAVLPVQEEVEMALSAAPSHLRDGAGVHILGPEGYVRHRASTNGFECLVEREGADGTAPICFDSEGAQTTLKAVFYRQALLQSGVDRATARQRTKAAYQRGELLAPRRPGIVYMLSTHFRSRNAKSNQLECVFPPHVMFYAPYLKNSDFGIPRSDFGSTQRPWILNEGEPDAYFIVADHSQEHSC